MPTIRDHISPIKGTRRVLVHWTFWTLEGIFQARVRGPARQDSQRTVGKAQGQASGSHWNLRMLLDHPANMWFGYAALFSRERL